MVVTRSDVRSYQTTERQPAVVVGSVGRPTPFGVQSTPIIDKGTFMKEANAKIDRIKSTGKSRVSMTSQSSMYSSASGVGTTYSEKHVSFSAGGTGGGLTSRHASQRRSVGGILKDSPSSGAVSGVTEDDGLENQQHFVSRKDSYLEQYPKKHTDYTYSHSPSYSRRSTEQQLYTMPNLKRPPVKVRWSSLGATTGEKVRHTLTHLYETESSWVRRVWNNYVLLVFHSVVSIATLRPLRQSWSSWRQRRALESYSQENQDNYSRESRESYSRERQQAERMDAVMSEDEEEEEVQREVVQEVDDESDGAPSSRSVLTVVWESWVSLWRGVWETCTWVTTSTVYVITQFFTSIWRGVTAACGGVASGVTSVVQLLVSGVTSALSGGVGGARWATSETAGALVNAAAFIAYGGRALASSLVYVASGAAMAVVAVVASPLYLVRYWSQRRGAEGLEDDEDDGGASWRHEGREEEAVVTGGGDWERREDTVVRRSTRRSTTASAPPPAAELFECSDTEEEMHSKLERSSMLEDEERRGRAGLCGVPWLCCCCVPWLLLLTALGSLLSSCWLCPMVVPMMGMAGNNTTVYIPPPRAKPPTLDIKLVQAEVRKYLEAQGFLAGQQKHGDSLAQLDLKIQELGTRLEGVLEVDKAQSSELEKLGAEQQRSSKALAADILVVRQSLEKTVEDARQTLLAALTPLAGKEAQRIVDQQMAELRAGLEGRVTSAAEGAAAAAVANLRVELERHVSVTVAALGKARDGDDEAAAAAAAAAVEIRKDREAAIIAAATTAATAELRALLLEREREAAGKKVEKEEPVRAAPRIVAGDVDMALVNNQLSEMDESLRAWVKAWVASVFTTYSQDRTGKVDYALESAGGYVVGTRCTQTYPHGPGLISVLGIPLWYTRNSPRTVIQPDTQPGNCWAFVGRQGYLVIHLAARVVVEGVTLEHIPRQLAPSGDINSAPRDFELLGLASEKDYAGVSLGNFTYHEDRDPLQHFPVSATTDRAFEVVEVRVKTNHGHPDYTCIYRVRVHGNRPHVDRK